MSAHENCPLGSEAESFPRRVRELESAFAAHQADYARFVTQQEKDHVLAQSSLSYLEEEVDKMRILQAKWLGAIAVIVFLMSFVATVLGRVLTK